MTDEQLSILSITDPRKWSEEIGRMFPGKTREDEKREQEAVKEMWAGHQIFPVPLINLPRNAGYVCGYSVKWADVSRNDPMRISAGAFRNFLISGQNCELWTNHDGDRGVLASLEDGNLFLAEDIVGLFLSAKLPDNFLGRHIKTWGENFGFGVSIGRQNIAKSHKSPDGILIVDELSLREISLLTVKKPAFKQSRAQVVRPMPAPKKLIVFFDRNRAEAKPRRKGLPVYL